jgi:hypothetical protein
MKLGKALRAKSDPDLQRLGTAISLNSGRTPHENYQNFFGEADARNMAFRDTLTQAQRDSRSPGATLESDVVLTPKALIDVDAWDAARDVTRPATRAWSGYDTDKQIENLLVLLRNKRVIR